MYRINGVWEYAYIRIQLYQWPWDRGMELAQHKQFPVATDMQVYFCDLQSHQIHEYPSEPDIARLQRARIQPSRPIQPNA